MDREELMKEAERLRSETRSIDNEREKAPQKFASSVVNDIATAWWKKNGDSVLRQFGLK